MSEQNPLKQKIIERIASEGPISFEEFMGMALYYPGLGYYAKQEAHIGREGDFYTSPHLHPLFGAMLGKQMEELWRLLGNPSEFQIVEMGAGMGWLAFDILNYLRRRKIFGQLRYTIIEINPSIKRKQSELLKEFRDKVEWADGLNYLGQFTGCFLSNELPDAFPVRLVRFNNGLKEIFVTTNRNGEFEEVERHCSPEVERYFEEFKIDIASAMEGGYQTEVNLKIRDWIGDIGQKLISGFVLTVDYGYPADEYYCRERNRGTLLCYYKHEVSDDPYQNIGEQDITAHVNFSSLQKWGEEAGLKALGFAPQGTYLISLGMDEVMAEMPELASDLFDSAKIKGLLLPEGMGESHKVMIQYKGNGEPVLKGFQLRNRKKYL